jgi:Ca2+-transporting ATPase
MSAISLVVIALSTELGILQRILDSVPLTGEQWLVCILGSATVLVASELQKLVLRRRETA